MTSMPALLATVSLFSLPPVQGANIAAGTLKVNSRSVELKHAAAVLLDNAEKLLDSPRELRILLTDRPVPIEALYGPSFPPIWDMATTGQVQGLLLSLDPGKPTEVHQVLLLKPEKAGMSLMNTSLSKSSGVFKPWRYGGGRVSGEIAQEGGAGRLNPDIPAVSYLLRFEADVVKEPAVTQDLKGTAARESPQVKALLAQAAALEKGDFPAARKLMTARASAWLDRMIQMAGPQAKAQARQGAAELRKMLKGALRVVVRGERAVVILPEKSSTSLRREGGVWKADG